MKTAASLLLLSASMAAAETCSGFETRLNALAAQVQQMIDIVDGMTPGNYPTCGGIVGTKISVGNLITSIPTGPSSANPTRRYDHQWCCEQCIETQDCAYWSLQMRDANVDDETKMRCQLYSEEWDPTARANQGVDNGAPGAYLFPVGLGVGEAGVGAKRISGKVPEMGRWGGSTDGSSATTLKYTSNYMVDIELNGAGGAATLVWNNVTGDPTAPMAEGFEVCDSLGAFKAQTGSPNNGNARTHYTRHPLECCSLCVRNMDMDGNALPSQCAIWTYNYDPKKRQCVTRDNNYSVLGGFDADTSQGIQAFQEASTCAKFANDGVTQRYHPGGDPCTGNFAAFRWSSGNSYSRDTAALQTLVLGS